jgi:hypothetical protein
MLNAEGCVIVSEFDWSRMRSIRGPIRWPFGNDFDFHFAELFKLKTEPKIYCVWLMNRLVNS